MDSVIIDLAAQLRHAEQLPHRWVNTQAELDTLVTKMPTYPMLAIDTEFIKRSTYYPVLALIQINTDDCIYLLDAPVLELTGFWLAVSQCQRIIFHSGSEDLQIVYDESELPPLDNFFDTQIALSFLGYRLQMGYQNAIKDCLGVEIEKGESRSDWLQRPLTESQLHYAIDDVRYLLVLYRYLHQQLVEQNKLGYVIADCHHYAVDLWQLPEDSLVYLDSADFRYSRYQLAQLQQLCEWREHLARNLDQPRTFILRKQALRTLIEEQPRNYQQLAESKTIHRNILEQYSDTILSLLHDLPDDSDRYPHQVARPFRAKDSPLMKYVDDVLAQAQQQTGVPKEVLLRKRWLNELLAHVAYQKPDDSLSIWLTSWRKEIITRPLLQHMRQHQHLLTEHIVPRYYHSKL